MLCARHQKLNIIGRLLLETRVSPVKFYSTRFFTHFKPQNFVLFANEMAGFFQRAVTYVLHNTYGHNGLDLPSWHLIISINSKVQTNHAKQSWVHLTLRSFLHEQWIAHFTEFCWWGAHYCNISIVWLKINCNIFFRSSLCVATGLALCSKYSKLFL